MFSYSKDSFKKFEIRSLEQRIVLDGALSDTDTGSSDEETSPENTESFITTPTEQNIQEDTYSVEEEFIVVLSDNAIFPEDSTLSSVTPAEQNIQEDTCSERAEFIAPAFDNSDDNAAPPENSLGSSSIALPEENIQKDSKQEEAALIGTPSEDSHNVIAHCQNVNALSELGEQTIYRTMIFSEYILCEYNENDKEPERNLCSSLAYILCCCQNFSNETLDRILIFQELKVIDASTRNVS